MMTGFAAIAIAVAIDAATVVTTAAVVVTAAAAAAIVVVMAFQRGGYGEILGHSHVPYQFLET